MSNRLGGKQGTAYTGTNANQPPNVTFNDRPPTQYDTQNVSINDFWVDRSATGIHRIWVLVSLEGNMNSKGSLAQWVQFGTGTVESLTGNSGGPVGPDGSNNINVVGDTSTVTIAGNPGTHTLTASTGPTVATSYVTNPATGTAVPAAGVLTFAGTAGINISAAGSTVTVSSGGTPVPICAFAASKSANSTNVTGDGTFYTVIFDQELFDVSSNYNNATGVFTAPSDGEYHFDTYVSCQNITDQVFTGINIITTSTAYHTDLKSAVNVKNGDSILTLKFSIVVQMSTGDTAHVEVAIGGGSDSKTVLVAGNAVPASPVATYFGGYRIDPAASFITGTESYVTDAGTAVPNLSGVINVIGGSGVSTAGAGNTITIASSSTPTASVQFSARKSADSTNATGDTTVFPIVCNTVIQNIGGGYNGGTGVFTAPVSGLYYLMTIVDTANTNSSHTVGLVDFASHSYDYNPFNMATSSSTGCSYVCSQELLMNMGDTVQPSVAISGGTKTVTVQGGVSNRGCFFNGFLIGTTGSTSFNGFLAFQNANLNAVTGDGTAYTVLFQATQYDTASGYNAGTGVYTVPTTGYWKIYAQLQYVANPMGGGNQVDMGIQGISFSGGFSGIQGTCIPTANQCTGYFGPNRETTLQSEIVAFLTAGDTISVQVIGDGGTKTDSLIAPPPGGGITSYFMGNLIV